MKKSLVLGAVLSAAPLFLMLPGCSGGASGFGSTSPTPTPTPTIPTSPVLQSEYNFTVQNSRDSNFGFEKLQGNSADDFESGFFVSVPESFKGIVIYGKGPQNDSSFAIEKYQIEVYLYTKSPLKKGDIFPISGSTTNDRVSAFFLVRRFVGFPGASLLSSWDSASASVVGTQRGKLQITDISSSSINVVISDAMLGAGNVEAGRGNLTINGNFKIFNYRPQ